MSYNAATNFTQSATKEHIKENWIKWFAWYPVEVDGKKVWLRNVYRRWCYTQIFGEQFSERYEYGNLFDVLGSD